MQHTSWLDKLNGNEFGRVWAWGNNLDQLGDYVKASPCEMSDIPQSRPEPVLIAEATRRGAEFRFYTEFVSLVHDDLGVSVTLRSRETHEEKSKLVLNTEAPSWSAVGNFRMAHRWDEFVVSMHPASKDSTTFSPSRAELLERLHQMIGDATVPVEILSHFTWTINDQVAETWQQGRVLCIGDATHRHPPINGLGSNTCISDALNLAWKLAYVLQGCASPSLLDSLTPERKPVGDGVVRRVNEGMEAHRRLWDILGTTKASCEEAELLLRQHSAQGRMKRQELKRALEATEDEVQALGIQMNHVYLGIPGAVCLVEPGDARPDFSSINTLCRQLITTFPGYHVPHIYGKGNFTLLTGIGGKPWREAVNAVLRERGDVINIHSIGIRCDYIDCYGDWGSLREVDDDGAILVRPDHSVAWRSIKASPKAEEKLFDAFKRLLGK
ncbi:hypothetical protein VHEMI01014 [[Torrubiella] hemipterigena]|uniref:FAD-binding domain-containing protein n=1 Tax=[Torrubiella] hemipterigena TaxID=1531966 RepID=A0A0A1T680_9HYPO|nr:hypothetical protein VHEMI01014 [[Torrubiella] hemipterigena]